MAATEDWRLTFEAEWMYGAVLERRRFTPPTPDWDHEHCTLCQAKFMAEALQDTIQEGFVHGYDRSQPMPPLDDRRVPAPPDAQQTGFGTGISAPTMEEWICPTCFADFAARFGWTATELPHAT
jgi:hypothetical protein